ncbi:MAG: YnfA family protein [Candidatus Nitrohelix vancouverensis]|uniref:YnfA family protein n=1 Tax=Candidatus Nitrohelix vancouverensis TaxID=2705534 RepID=A0A7T0C3X6_9BACT|nr:MAG: YnfA family protein [Candidatus Nitrohelix vancouverensis]
MTSLAIYFSAAMAEIGGCFAFWAWLRLGKTAYWLIPGIALLALFAFLLTQLQSEFAGRTYAAYGGVYILASLLWLWAVEGQTPDRWDTLGAVVSVAGAVIIFYGPRTTV